MGKKSTKKITKLLIYRYCHHVAVLLDFKFQILHGNTIAYLWKQSQNAIIDVPDITTNDLINYDEIKWVESIFPQDIENLVVDYSSDIDNVFGSDVETEEEY